MNKKAFVYVFLLLTSVLLWQFSSVSLAGDDKKIETNTAMQNDGTTNDHTYAAGAPANNTHEGKKDSLPSDFNKQDGSNGEGTSGNGPPSQPPLNFFSTPQKKEKCYLCHTESGNYAMTPCCEKDICKGCYDSAKNLRCGCGQSRLPTFHCELCSNTENDAEHQFTEHFLSQHRESLSGKYKVYQCNYCTDLHTVSETDEDSVSDEVNLESTPWQLLCASCVQFNNGILPIESDQDRYNHYLQYHSHLSCPFPECEFETDGCGESDVKESIDHINTEHNFILQTPPSGYVPLNG